MAAPNLTEIEYVIQELKTRESSYENYLLLAAFCVCRDELTGASRQPSPIVAYSMATEPVAISRASDALGLYGESDFLRAVEGKDPADVWAVMDKLMDTLKLSFPRAYNRVMREMLEL